MSAAELLGDLDRLGVKVVRVPDLDVGGSYVPARRVVLLSADLVGADETAVVRLVLDADVEAAS